MATVYFDACFYSYLGAADDDEAVHAIARLRRMGVRPALSRILLNEIRASDGRNQPVLFERVNELPSPLPLDEDVGWDVLEAAPDPGFYRALGAASNRVSAASAAARTGSMTKEQAEQLLSESGRPAPRWDVQGQEAEEAGLAQLRALMNPATLQIFATMGVDVPPLPKSDDEAKEWTEWSLAFMAATREVIPIPVARAETHEQMFDSTGAGGSSLGSVAVDDASKKAHAKVRDRANDSEHMTLFALNHERIDYLHIDGVRWRQLRSNKGHALRRRGLHERCFTGGNSVTGIVDALGERVEKLGWPTSHSG